MNIPYKDTCIMFVDVLSTLSLALKLQNILYMRMLNNADNASFPNGITDTTTK